MKNKLIAFMTAVALALPAATAAFAATAELPEGTTNPDLNRISGSIWEDKNTDNVFTQGTDVTIAGVTINVLDASTKEQKYTATSDTDGSYYFELDPNSYILQFVFPNEYKYYNVRTSNLTLDKSDYAEINGSGIVEIEYITQRGSNTILDSSLTKMGSVWLQGVVWYDANSNTIRPAVYDYEEPNTEGADEIGIQGAEITVTNEKGEKVAAGTTDEIGVYGFEVPAGMNTIKVTSLPEAFKDYGYTTPENGIITREFTGNDEVFIDFGLNEKVKTNEPSPSPSPTPKPTKTPSSQSTPSPSPTTAPAAPTPTPEPTGTPAPQNVPELNKTEHYAYVVGYDDGTIRPENNISRQEVATIFFRLLTDASRNYFYADDNTFTDVSQSLWSNIAISTMSKAGIVSGYDAATFMPQNNITRAEFATIAAKFDSSTYIGPDKFTDISGHWAAEYINRAAEKGWISGYNDNTFKPDDYITRAEAMTLINNVLDRHVEESGMLSEMTVWPDNTPDKWYYTPVQEATNSHYYEKGASDYYEKWTSLRETRNWEELERK